MGDYLEQRANMARAYAAAAADCKCSRIDSNNYSFNGPGGTTNGSTCANAQKAYESSFGKCRSVDTSGFTDTNPAVTIRGGKKTGEQPTILQSRFPTALKSNKDVPKFVSPSSKKKSDSSKKSDRQKVMDTSPDRCPEGSTGEECLTDTENKLTQESGGQFQPDMSASKDLFAGFPGLSKFFVDMYSKICGGSTTKIPFICASPAYLEIAFIVIIAVVLLLVLKKR